MKTNWNSKWIVLMLLALCLSGILAGQTNRTAAAQSEPGELRLTVNKVYGYNWRDEMRGTFRLTAIGPDDLQSVTFLIDGQSIGQVGQAPFVLDIQTTDFPAGQHELSVSGQTASGAELVSAARSFNFVTNEQSAASLPQALIPLFAILGGVALLIFIIQLIAFRPGNRKVIPLGAPRDYGMIGGAICPRCKRPYKIHWWGINAVAGKLDRCDHCGRWSLMHRASREALARAEAAELEMAGPAVPVSEKTEEERLREQLDKSKYTG